MAMAFEGRRRGDVAGNQVVPDDARPGDYWRGADGNWWAYVPKGGVGVLSKHQISEHEDGTITVSPSILTYKADATPAWHGYLRRGCWEEC